MSFEKIIRIVTPSGYRTPIRILYCSFVLLLLSNCTSNAQDQKGYFLVTFKDKPQPTSGFESSVLTEKSIARRAKHETPFGWHDYPISKAYLDSIKTLNIRTISTSRWLNAALIIADSAQTNSIAKLSFTKGYPQLLKSTTTSTRKAKRKRDKFSPQKTTVENNIEPNNKTQNELLGVQYMHQFGYNGKGLTIAVLDAGFKNAIKGQDTLQPFIPIYRDGRVLGNIDVIAPNTSVYEDHHHGTEVWGAMAGYVEGHFSGPAVGASFWLIRTEDVSSETRLEEYYWAKGAENADSLGVDIISSSLGYSTFDDISQNYSIQQLDGKTSIISRAATIAARAGILVVTSAGNEGQYPWRKITFPGDADSIITVGAVDKNNRIASFSSQGYTSDGRIKPDVVALGYNAAIINSQGNISYSNGTSFSAPQIAGFAAALWQALPQLKPMELKKVIVEASDRLSRPDSLYGHGTPNFLSIIKEYLPEHSISQGNLEDVTIAPNPIINSQIRLLFPFGEYRHPCKYEIVDTHGKKISEGVFFIPTPQITLDIPDKILVGGSYFIRLEMNDQKKTIRFVKS